MKKIFLSISMLLLVCTSCGTRIIGSGNLISVTRNTPSYTAIKVQDGLELIISSDSVGDLMITADDNILDYIVTEVVNNTLQISLKDHFRYRLHDPKITVPNTGLLTAIALHEGSDCKVSNTILQASAFSVSMYDGSEFDGNLNATSCTVVTKDGSEFDGNITANQLTLETFDGSEIDCNVIVQAATMNLQDGSEISVTGSADSCTATLSDGSRLKAGQFVVGTYTITASDGSSAQINCTVQLHQTTSDGSNVTNVHERK